MIRPKSLIRERMNRLLSAITDFPLTVVEAPAGYGKTTAMRDFLSSRGLESLWISFRSVSKPSEYFWRKLVEGFLKTDSAAGAALKSLELPVNTVQLNQMISILNRLELASPFIVILDNFELVTDPSLAKLIQQITEDEIENLHLVIVTRDTSIIDFVSLLSKGKCYAISQQQIKFTADETRDYCLLTADSITDGEIQKIAEYTDGWISMIYILLLGLEKNIPIGFNQTLDELIDKTLYRSHDRDTQYFLRQLSFMDGFTAKQAAFVTGNENADVLLKRLRQENAFILYDDREKEYKIHNVLLDFLKTKQDFTPEEERELYRRLGEWHLKRNELFKAYAYLARAGETRRVLAHLNSAAPRGSLYVDFDGADALFASASKPLLLENPVALLRYLFHCLITRKKEQMEQAPRWLNELEQFYQNKTDMDEKERNRILAEILCVRKFMSFNRLEEMHAYNEKITKLLDGRHSSVMLQSNDFTFGSPHYLYIYFRDAGTMKQTARLLGDNSSYVSFSDGCGMGCDCLAAAEYACETGDYQEALLESRKAVYRAETKAQLSVILCAQFSAARAAAALGKISTARETLRLMSSEVEKQGRAIYRSMLGLCTGYLYSSLGLPEKIPLWLKTGDIASLSLFFGGMGFDRLVYGKTLLAQGEFLKLEALSGGFDEAFGVFQNRLGFIHNAILLAAAKARLYGAEAGIPDLDRALSLALPDGIVLPFAESAAHLLPIFSAMMESEKRDDFTRRVKRECRQYSENLTGILPRMPELTDREKEVLNLLAEGLNRKEIAERLTISPATVKTHLQTIYRKLEADGRTSAVKAAQMNGLI